MEVLVEYLGSKQELFLPNTGDIGKVMKEKLGLGSAILLPFDEKKTSDSCYLLQKYSNKWNQHIDVKSCTDICDKDHLLVVKRMNEVKHSLSLCSKLGKPSESQAQALGKLFSASPKPISSSRFDPMVQCVAAEQQRKKKAATTITKPYKLWVVVMKTAQEKVPKGGSRKKLNEAGRVKKLEFRRCLSKQQVKNILIKKFPTLKMSNCDFYKSDADTKLVLCPIEGSFPSGQEITEIASKESLYVVEGIESSGEHSANLHLSPKKAKLMSRADELLSELKRPISCSSSESDSDDLPKISYNPKISIDLTKDNDPGLKEDIIRTREIIVEQNRQYEQSLMIDRDKASRMQQEARYAKRIEVVRSELRRHFDMEPQPQDEDSVVLSFRLPNSHRLDHVFPRSATTKVLYEFVFAHCELESGFHLYHQVPRTLVPCSKNSILEEAGICASIMFAVEQCDQDILTLLGDIEMKEDRVNVMMSDSSESSTNSCDGNFEVLLGEATKKRAVYMNRVGREGNVHKINRESLIHSLFEIYNLHRVDLEYPIRFKYENELAVDAGGVSRDVYGTFWDKVYEKFFDGVSCVTPAMNPSIEMDLFHVIGRILSHGYLVTGFLPIRMSFPSLCTMLLGNNVEIPDHILIDSFINYVSNREAAILQTALSSSSFSSSFITKLTDLLGAYNCFQVPSCRNLKALLCKIANCELIQKPLALLLTIHSGVTAEHSQFWKEQDVSSLYKLYCSMTCTAEKVLSHIISDPTSLIEQRTLRYFEQFVGNLSTKDLSTLLRFVTGLPVCTDKGLTITFNALSGLSRRPIAHTCHCQLHLPTTYESFTDFSSEMMSILDMRTWPMNAV